MSEARRPDLPAGIVELLEQAAEQLLLGVGDARLEAVFANGKLRFAWLHTGSFDRNELRERFDRSKPDG